VDPLDPRSRSRPTYSRDRTDRTCFAGMLGAQLVVSTSSDQCALPEQSVRAGCGSWHLFCETVAGGNRHTAGLETNQDTRLAALLVRTAHL